MKEYKVIVNVATGAHYDCATLEEANSTFESSPVVESGERLLTIDGVVTRREYIEVKEENEWGIGNTWWHVK